MESLKQAMKYMTESQGFDRVLNKVRATSERDIREGVPPATGR